MGESIREKLNSDKKIYAVALVVLACVIGFAVAKLQSTLPNLPLDEDDIAYANVVAYADGVETELQYLLDEDDVEDFLEIWHGINWKDDRAHSGDVAYEQTQNVLYMFSISYLVPWEGTIQTLWIYFCENGVMYIDNGLRGNDVFYETEGKYERLMNLFNQFEYTSGAKRQTAA